MLEYVCLEIRPEGEDTENMLNIYARKGWRLVCSYASDNRWLIMEREVKK
jgi:hypothetical protein